MQDLIFHEEPDVSEPVLIMGLTGWMDGGGVSMGTVDYLRERLSAERFAEIDPMDFYIHNFPISSLPVSVFVEEGRAVVTPVNPMEMAAVFRPHCRIEDGVVEELVYPANDFCVAEDENLVLFAGEEPHIRWGAFCDCIFGLARKLSISRVYFVGSVAAPIPHTREPRLRVSCSTKEGRDRIAGYGLGFSDYEGPASIITSLAWHSVPMEIELCSLVAEVPHYPFVEMPSYPPSIVRIVSALQDILGLELELSDLKASAQVALSRLDELREENADFRELVQKLEEAYDYEESEADEDLLRRLIDSVDIESEDDMK